MCTEVNTVSSRSRAGGDSATAAIRRELILKTARELMSEKGATAVTVRGVARAAGIAPGHLGYYFPSLDALHSALLDYVLAPYLETFEKLRGQSKGDPIAGLRSVLEYLLSDLATRETTMFFPALWELANHDDGARKRMRALYDRYMQVLKELIAELRSDLSEDKVAELALFVCASMEGQTVFIGYERPYARHRAALRKIGVYAMLETVEKFEG